METYFLLKHAHLGLVALSLGGFFGRGLGVLGGAAWPLALPLRRVVVFVDSLLMAAGLALWSQLGWAAMPWLFAKFGWLLAYILLGSLALKRAPTRAGKGLCWLLAWVCVAQLVATARTHHPLGFLAP